MRRAVNPFVARPEPAANGRVAQGDEEEQADGAVPSTAAAPSPRILFPSWSDAFSKNTSQEGRDSRRRRLYYQDGSSTGSPQSEEHQLLEEDDDDDDDDDGGAGAAAAGAGHTDFFNEQDMSIDTLSRVHGKQLVWRAAHTDTDMNQGSCDPFAAVSHSQRASAPAATAAAAAAAAGRSPSESLEQLQHGGRMPMKQEFVLHHPRIRPMRRSTPIGGGGGGALPFASPQPQTSPIVLQPLEDDVDPEDEARCEAYFAARPETPRGCASPAVPLQLYDPITQQAVKVEDLPQGIDFVRGDEVMDSDASSDEPEAQSEEASWDVSEIPKDADTLDCNHSDSSSDSPILDGRHELDENETVPKTPSMPRSSSFARPSHLAPPLDESFEADSIVFSASALAAAASPAPSITAPSPMRNDFVFTPPAAGFEGPAAPISGLECVQFASPKLSPVAERVSPEANRNQDAQPTRASHPNKSPGDGTENGVGVCRSATNLNHAGSFGMPLHPPGHEAPNVAPPPLPFASPIPLSSPKNVLAVPWPRNTPPRAANSIRRAQGKSKKLVMSASKPPLHPPKSRRALMPMSASKANSRVSSHRRSSSDVALANTNIVREDGYDPEDHLQTPQQLSKRRRRVRASQSEGRNRSIDRNRSIRGKRLDIHTPSGVHIHISPPAPLSPNGGNVKSDYVQSPLVPLSVLSTPRSGISHAQDLDDSERRNRSKRFLDFSDASLTRFSLSSESSDEENLSPQKEQFDLDASALQSIHVDALDTVNGSHDSSFLDVSRISLLDDSIRASPARHQGRPQDSPGPRTNVPIPSNRPHRQQLASGGHAPEHASAERNSDGGGQLSSQASAVESLLTSRLNALVSLVPGSGNAGSTLPGQTMASQNQHHSEMKASAFQHQAEPAPLRSDGFQLFPNETRSAPRADSPTRTAEFRASPNPSLMNESRVCIQCASCGGDSGILINTNSLSASIAVAESRVKHAPVFSQVAMSRSGMMSSDRIASKTIAQEATSVFQPKEPPMFSERWKKKYLTHYLRMPPTPSMNFQDGFMSKPTKSDRNYSKGFLSLGTSSQDAVPMLSARRDVHEAFIPHHIPNPATPFQEVMNLFRLHPSKEYLEPSSSFIQASQARANSQFRSPPSAPSSVVFNGHRNHSTSSAPRTPQMMKPRNSDINEISEKRVMSEPASRSAYWASRQHEHLMHEHELPGRDHRGTNDLSMSLVRATSKLRRAFANSPSLI